MENNDEQENVRIQHQMAHYNMSSKAQAIAYASYYGRMNHSPPGMMPYSDMHGTPDPRVPGPVFKSSNYVEIDDEFPTVIIDQARSFNHSNMAVHN